MSRTDPITDIVPVSRTLGIEQSPPPAARAEDSGRDGAPREADLVCLSHLRWDFVFQRPQHLLTRFGRERRVFFVEEPVLGSDDRIELMRRQPGVTVVRPHLPDAEAAADPQRLRRLIDRLFAEQRIADHVLWFYTPMAVPFTHHLRPSLVVYDCMDELSAFAGAPPAMQERERQLMAWADVVFTGGQSLYEAKRDRHPQVHAFPSSIDREHFAQARADGVEPADQAGIARPRIGFFGVIDERLDLALLDSLARARSDWHFVLIGPVVKIDPATLPRHPNLHWLGRKDYADLPAYLAGWDVAMLPFARNASTRYISPTKTPEYLAAGRPVVSTPITDVVRPYGDLGLVRIADDADSFAAAIAAASGDAGDARWRAAVDGFLAGTSWEQTWRRMRALMHRIMRAKGVDPRRLRVGR